ncbi:6835_t:CDS:1, partial [Racocetra persica]
GDTNDKISPPAMMTPMATSMAKSKGNTNDTNHTWKGYTNDTNHLKGLHERYKPPRRVVRMTQLTTCKEPHKTTQQTQTTRTMLA